MLGDVHRLAEAELQPAQGLPARQQLGGLGVQLTRIHHGRFPLGVRNAVPSDTVRSPRIVSNSVGRAVQRDWTLGAEATVTQAVRENTFRRAPKSPLE
ncbi:hypothetical protein SY2F82_69910 [Streptomyces sp. Y2F8-2]|nr:hypothetical protein SY2F82_69910 [Streptomyces sp. Y2F8-2]